MANKQARRQRNLDPTELLRDSEAWPTSLTWPAAIDKRLETLRDAYERQMGFRPSRGDVVAALVFNAPSDAKALVKLVTEYKTGTVGHALPGHANTEGVIPLPERHPGRSKTS
jgi:hypothetical protein